MHTVLDVSKWQGRIDWQAVKSGGVGCTTPFAAIIRIGYGTKSIDPWAHTNLSITQQAKIPRGMYWYAPEPLTTEAQIDKVVAKCWDFVKLYKPEYPVYLDIEGKQTADKKRMAALCQYWQKACIQLGIYPGLYGSEKVLYANNDLPCKDISWWIANYTREPDKDYNLWQYTSSGRVAGIGGPVDLSHCITDYKAIIKTGGYNAW